MESKEKLKGGSLPELGKEIQSAQENIKGTGGEANRSVIIPSLEKAKNSKEEVSKEDHQQKTLSENGRDSSDPEENVLPEGGTQVQPHPGKGHTLENAPDVSGDDGDVIKPHDTSALPLNSHKGDNIQNPDAPDTTVVEEIQLPGEGHGWLNEANAEANGDEKEDFNLQDVSVLPVGLMEIDNIKNTDASDTLVFGEVQLLEKGTSDPSYHEEQNDLKNMPAEVNEKYNEDNKDEIEVHEALTSNSQEVDNIHKLDLINHHQPEECEASKMGYASFIQTIYGCLDELKENNEEVNQVNGDDGIEMRESPDTPSTSCLEYSEYFEPALFDIILHEVNNELDYETCSEDESQAWNKSYSYITLEMDRYERHLPKLENSFLEGTEAPPDDHTSAIISVGTLPTRSSRRSTFQKGFHYTNLKLPVPDNLREHCWVAAVTDTFNLGTSGFSYIGGIADGQMHGFGRLMLGDSRQFLDGVWSANRLVELYSCNLICDPGNQTAIIIKRQNDHLLTMYETHYIARVFFNALEELNFTVDTANLKRHFFRKVRVLELVADELEQKKQVSLTKFATLLARAISVDADTIVRANTFILLSVYLAMPDTVLSDILRDGKLPVEVGDAAAELLDCEKRYLSNIYTFSNRASKLGMELRNILQKIYNDGIVQHRQILISKCPSTLPGLLSSIRSLPESKIVYVTCEDMSVFDHVVSQPCFEQYKDFFTNLADRFSQSVHNIKNHTAPSTVIPVMSPVYGFLVKSFWEVTSEIIAVVGSCEYKDMLKNEAGNWKLKENIQWPKNEVKEPTTQKVLKFFESAENKSSMLHRTLEVQYNTIFQMMTYFSPENYRLNRKYKCDFRVLEQDLCWWEKGLKMVHKKVGLAKRLQKLSNERILWLCLLDHTIYEVFKDDPKYRILLKPYNSLLQGQISFIEKSSTESHETFRVATHSILKFITSTAPYFRETQDKPRIDVEILVQQIWTFSTASQEVEKAPTAFSNFRDLIAEYNRYLSLRLFIDIEATSGHFSEKISRMMKTFMRIVATSLKKSVPTTTLVGYLRSLNDFLDDFKNIDFLAMWFVKSEFFDPNVLEKVDNKLLSGGNCSYRVIDCEKFVEVVQNLGNHPIPRHYIIQVVTQLFKCVETCLNKQWESRDVELQVTQLECTALLLDAIRKSFMYLKEQPDYIDFQTFEKESTDPFLRLVHDCKTSTDLKDRTTKVSESFWYIRKMDEIGIDRALDMFKSVNSCRVSNKLLDCYNLYLEYYNEYIKEYMSLVSNGKSHAEGMNEVVQMVGKPNPMHFSMWTEDFKTKEIPVILAGLSAVWSIMVSKDASSSGKFLKPHCIQILCVLRLLSVDLPGLGAENHLAEVLTGQGKSLILGLLSAVLAGTGHEVKVLCYSDYLSTRDRIDYDEFFRAFQLSGKIEYGTFEDMANSFVNPTINGHKSSLRELVQERVMNHTSWPSKTIVRPVSKNTILLIDEVDVFFTDKFYGNGYFPVTRQGFQGLAEVQELIWSLATNNHSYSSEQIAQLSIELINSKADAKDEGMMEFNAFLNKPGTFPLLIGKVGGNIAVKTYTNRDLFDEHLLEMINDAFMVRDSSYAQSSYALTVGGIIGYKDKNGIFTTSSYDGYWNVFNYFRLKQSDYDTKKFQNYGYFHLSVGEISYARLPSQFQLILGVSGTLTNLGEYERTGIEFYGIHRFSVLPSFFGESNLEFKKEADFCYFMKEQDWLKKIYDRANSIIDSHRATLIFFESDDAMLEFSEEYKTKFNRLNKITENTDKSVRNAYIDEAGLSCTVTLATRGMGRGVDYKSSLSIEKKGGVHVIQTFYSIDVKEEVQIKGRTARKDNKGTYELVICREHLVKDKIIPEDDHNIHSYGSLETIRKELSDEKGKTVSEKVQQSERNHNTTIKYFGLM